MTQTIDDEIRPSATVVLVRESDGAPQLFMVKRHAGLSFGSAYAFPGGVLDAADCEVESSCTGVDAALANARLGVEDGGLAYYSAAIRELFEESGVLLASTALDAAQLCIARDGLNDGSRSWSDFVQDNRLQLHCGALHYISHWITPVVMEKRYTTRFFLAVVPREQVAEHCGGELTESRWATASDMLTASRERQVKLHFPTIKVLESIARYDSVLDLLDWAQSCVDWGVTTMLPAVIERDGEPTVVLPGEKDYPGA